MKDGAGCRTPPTWTASRMIHVTPRIAPSSLHQAIMNLKCACMRVQPCSCFNAGNNFWLNTAKWVKSWIWIPHNGGKKEERIQRIAIKNPLLLIRKSCYSLVFKTAPLHGSDSGGGRKPDFDYLSRGVIRPVRKKKKKMVVAPTSRKEFHVFVSQIKADARL